MKFEYDEVKNQANITKHGVSFEDAKLAFGDSKRVIAKDVEHSTSTEQRYFCYGKVEGRIMTVRFTKRNAKIRIIGAGYWRKGKQRYDKGI